MNIIETLKTKPHNIHYLNKYINFIEKYKHQDKIYGMVKHHILPKAKDMFSEFKSFKKYPDNCIILTERQHYISHMLLWKSFPTIISTCYSAHRMKSYQNNKKITSKIYENLKIQFKKQQSDRAKLQHKNMSNELKQQRSLKISNFNKGLVLVKNKQGLIFKVSKDEFDKNDNLYGITKGESTMMDKKGNYLKVLKDDPRIISGELVGVNKGKPFPFKVKKGKDNHLYGIKRSKQTRDKMSKSMTGIKKKQHTCPHCNLVGRGGGMKTFHFDNCKMK